jgi:hypothetical protein
LLVDVQLKIDPRSKRALEQSGETGNELFDVHCCWLERLAPSEGQEPLNQGLGALGRLHCSTDEPLLALVAETSPHEHVE